MGEPVISCDPEVMGGAPVFAGTRVPVQTLLDYLEAGDSIDDFVEGFPSVQRSQVVEFLQLREVERRLAAHREVPHGVVSWDEVCVEALARIRPNAAR